MVVVKSCTACGLSGVRGAQPPPPPRRRGLWGQLQRASHSAQRTAGEINERQPMNRECSAESEKEGNAYVRLAIAWLPMVSVLGKTTTHVIHRRKGFSPHFRPMSRSIRQATVQFHVWDPGGTCNYIHYKRCCSNTWNVSKAYSG